MPLYIGDYLADTMHLNTQQHGAYLLLLFHLWRRGTLPDDDTALAKITGLTPKEWTSVRLVLEPYFTVNNGLWQHSRVERERVRIAARQEKRGIRAKSAALARWDKHASSIACGCHTRTTVRARYKNKSKSKNFFRFAACFVSVVVGCVLENKKSYLP